MKHIEYWQSYHLIVTCTSVSFSQSVSSTMQYKAGHHIPAGMNTSRIHFTPRTHVPCPGRIINKMVISGLKSHKNITLIPPLSQITAFTFTQHNICAVTPSVEDIIYCLGGVSFILCFDEYTGRQVSYCNKVHLHGNCTVHFYIYALSIFFIYDFTRPHLKDKCYTFDSNTLLLSATCSFEVSRYIFVSKM